MSPDHAAEFTAVITAVTKWATTKNQLSAAEWKKFKDRSVFEDPYLDWTVLDE